MTYDAILFDMDGVIIDTHEPVTRFWNNLAAQHNITLSPADFEAHIYGVPADATFDRLFPLVTGDVRREIYAQLEADELTQIYTEIAGVSVLLRSLQAAGVPRALVTSGARWKVAQVKAQLGLDGMFDTEVTVEDITHGKPNPECYLLAAHRLGIDPSRCLVFEDSLAGASAGVAAGASVVGIQQVPGLLAKLRQLGVQQSIPDFCAVRVKGKSINILES